MKILTFPPDYWDGPRHNRHYFCEALAKRHKILFVSPPFYIVDLIRNFGKRRLHKSEVRYINPNLLVYSPSKLLFTNHRFPRINRFLRYLRNASIKRLIRSHGIDKPILLIWHPRFVDMIGQFDEALVVYYIYDNLAGYTGGDASKRSQDEIKLIKKADITFVLSRELYDQNKKLSPNIHLLSNAVDYDLFSQSRSDQLPVPQDISEIPGPRIGYIGTINEKVDLDILEYIADKRANWSIVLIGRDNYQVPQEKRRFDQFVERKNVYRLDYRPYDSIPGYIKSLDACLMCYVINDWTYYGDPSKMHEYLSSGKPTVATGLSSIKEFEHVIDIPVSLEGWIESIERGLAEKDDTLRNARIEVAKQNSYTERVNRAEEIIAKTLRDKK